MVRHTWPALLFLCAWATLPAGDLHGQTRNEEAEFEQIARLLRVSQGTTVADVGAGGGSWTVRFATRVGPQGRVYATDVKLPQVSGIRSSARARGLDNVTAILGSQEDSGLPANCCEALLLRLLYHAFDNPERMGVSLQRAMKPNGLVLVVDFRPPPEQLTREMKDAGFERVQFIERWQNRPELYAALFRKGGP